MADWIPEGLFLVNTLDSEGGNKIKLQYICVQKYFSLVSCTIMTGINIVTRW